MTPKALQLQQLLFGKKGSDCLTQIEALSI